ncbi:MAG: hypothetical protein KDJ14_07020, partial [Xanthomonadales bacterium]|nr:hypothetical protein [Xanthomonadales bacterium]
LLILDSLFDGHSTGAEVVDFRTGSGATRYLTISNTQFADNQIRALTVHEQGVVSISQSSIGNHHVEDGVAGVFARGALVDIRTTTIADNVSTAGTDGVGARTAAILVEDSTLVLEDSSLVGNDTFAAPGQGASGIEALNSHVTIRNSVLANTQFGEANLWRRGNTVVDMSHSLLTPPDAPGEINGAGSSNVFTAVAAFGPLGDYGCARRIGSISDRCVGMRPHSTFATPIINTGSSTASFDQRGAGFARDDGQGVDMGAFELQPPQVELVTATRVLPEGNGGTTAFTYTLRRNGDLRGTTQVSWQVQGDGAAPANAADFGGPVLPFGSAFFNADQRETTVSVPVQGDLDAEADDGFRLLLTQITDGLAGDSTTATGSILNDDVLFVVPTISLHGELTDLVEGSLGFYATHRFRVTRTQDTSGFCTFAVELAGAGLDPIEQSDLFEGMLGISGTFQMAPGATTADIEVRIAADSEFEGDEGFSVTLVNPSGCSINQSARTALSTVINDDSLFALESVNAVRVEGDAGSTAFAFEVTRSGAVDQTATVSWTVSGTGAHPATADDFSGGVLPSGQVSMPPGV